MTTDPASRHVVVDGSNLATEGRSLPSLMQLDEAVRAYRDEWPDDDVLVVVDASFGHRIDESERKIFEEAEDAGEIVSPPAGAIGRGDGFLLRIADRTGAVVLSNDSFQEFHGDYQWLFNNGRLVGGKPVPGVGWIFTPRTPVRGPKSRVATRDAVRSRRRPPQAAKPEPVAEAIAEATAEALVPQAPALPSVQEDAPERDATARRSRRRGAPQRQPEAINEPLPFITFIANHPLGTEVSGTVESFTSHGAFVIADGARCYAPVVGLGDPPPRSAKEVLKREEVHTFVIQALDPPRRGIELALPGLARVAGTPTEETVEAEIDLTEHAVAEKAVVTRAGKRMPVKKAVVKKAAVKKAAVKKAAVKKAVVKKPVVKKPAAPARPATKVTTKAVTKKAAAKKASPAKKAGPVTKKVAAKKAAPVVKAAAKKASPAKKAAPVVKAAAKKVGPAKKAAASRSSR